ncbi:MAG TPA: S-layer homology domain-containing protein [Bacillota bacterium]|nr:S-layer homology domain-containing protein [Bacillota bacterium]
MYHKLRPRLLKLIILTAITMALPLVQVEPAFAASTETIPSWAANEIQTWRDLGLLKGDQSGLIHPNDNLTRAEFMAFVNRVFNFTELSNAVFTDVPGDAWYAADISKAYAAGITSGIGSGKMAPLAPITREEAASILSRAFYVNEAKTSGGAFPDDGQLSSWARQAAYAMRDAGYISGDESGAFMPKKNATRAEVIKMINNIMGQLIAAPGTYSDINGRNVIVNTSGVTLSNLNISGDLYITCGAGQGSVTLRNSNITGTVFVIGKSSVSVEGSRINTLSVGSGAAGSVVNLDAGSSLQNLIAGAKVNVTGQGSIASATINANGVNIEPSPAKVILNADSAIIAGKTVTKNPGEQTPAETAGSGGHSNHGGHTSPESYETDLYTYDDVLNTFADTGAESLVKQYITFLQDPTYTPGIANTDTYVPDFTNAITFVNKDFTVHPSLFPALREVNTSVLDSGRSNLWIGTDTGVTKIKLADSSKTDYNLASKDLNDDKVLLLISDGGTGVYAITETGVSHIKR